MQVAKKLEVARGEFSILEEVVHSLTHGVGTFLSFGGLVVLIVFGSIYGTAWHVVSYSIFGASLILLYTSSTLYHWFQAENIKKIFRVFDHSTIYILIAGSYTPYCLVPLRGGLGWSIFGVIWGLALIGVSLKIYDINRYESIANVLYLAMGWLVAFFFSSLSLHLNDKSTVLLTLGGLSYSLGFIFYAVRRIPYNHVIWHLFVLLGSIFHYFSILFFLF